MAVDKISKIIKKINQKALYLKPIYLFFRELGVIFTIVTIFCYLFYMEDSQRLFFTFRAEYFQHRNQYINALSDYKNAALFAEKSGDIQDIIDSYKKILNIYDTTGLNINSFAYKYIIGRLYEHSNDEINASIYYKQLNGHSENLLRKIEIQPIVFNQDVHTEILESISKKDLSEIYTEIAYFFEQQADCSFMEAVSEELNKTLKTLDIDCDLFHVERKGSDSILLASYGECSMSKSLMDNVEEILPKILDKNRYVLAFKENKLIADYQYYKKLADSHKEYYLHSIIFYEKALKHNDFNRFAREQINSINTKISIIVDRLRFYFLSLIRIVEKKG